MISNTYTTAMYNMIENIYDVILYIFSLITNTNNIDSECDTDSYSFDFDFDNTMFDYNEFDTQSISEYNTLSICDSDSESFDFEIDTSSNSIDSYHASGGSYVDFEIAELEFGSYYIHTPEDNSPFVVKKPEFERFYDNQITICV